MMTFASMMNDDDDTKATKRKRTEIWSAAAAMQRKWQTKSKNGKMTVRLLLKLLRSGFILWCNVFNWNVSVRPSRSHHPRSKMLDTELHRLISLSEIRIWRNRMVRNDYRKLFSANMSMCFGLRSGLLLYVCIYETSNSRCECKRRLVQIDPTWSYRRQASANKQTNAENRQTLTHKKTYTLVRISSMSSITFGN